MKKTAKCRFTMKEAGDGTPYVRVEPYGHSTLLRNGSLNFQLEAKADFARAQQLADYLNDHIDGLHYQLTVLFASGPKSDNGVSSHRLPFLCVLAVGVPDPCIRP